MNRAAARISSLAVGALLLLSSGCGYHFLGENPQLPSDIQSIAVGQVLNLTREHGLEKRLMFALEREIHIRRHYRLAQKEGAADAVLTGTIKRLERRPVAFDANDQAVIYELAMTIDLKLARRDDGTTLWRIRNYRKTDEYSADPRTVITSSSEFQRGTLDSSNLDLSDGDDPTTTTTTRTIGSIQLAESERARAVDRLMGRSVRDNYTSMIEGF